MLWDKLEANPSPVGIDRQATKTMPCVAACPDCWMRFRVLIKSLQTLLIAPPGSRGPGPNIPALRERCAVP
jgi:hypothetical protein